MSNALTPEEEALSDLIVNHSLADQDTKLRVRDQDRLDHQYRVTEGDVVTRFSLKELLHNAPRLSKVTFTGEYTDLLNTPALSPVALSGDFYDLVIKPSKMSDFAFDLVQTGILSPLAVSGSWYALVNRPARLSQMFDTFDLVEAGRIDRLAVTGEWADVHHAPTFLSQFTNDLGLKQVAFSGLMGDISDRVAVLQNDLTAFVNPVAFQGGSVSVREAGGTLALQVEQTATESRLTGADNCDIVVRQGGVDILRASAAAGIRVPSGQISLNNHVFDGSYWSLRQLPQLTSQPFLDIVDPDAAVLRLLASTTDTDVGANVSYIGGNLRITCDATTALTVDGEGNVAVGPSLPGKRLHVQNGDVLVGGDIELSGSLRLDVTAASDRMMDAVLGCTRLYAPGDRQQPVVYVTGDGAVGVLTQQPGYTLDVNGSLGVSGLAQLPGAQFSSSAVNLSSPLQVYSATKATGVQPGIITGTPDLTLQGQLRATSGGVVVGDVAIDPVAQLDVRGTARVSGSTTLAGALTCNQTATFGAGAAVTGDATVSGSLTAAALVGTQCQVDQLAAVGLQCSGTASLTTVAAHGASVTTSLQAGQLAVSGSTALNDAEVAQLLVSGEAQATGVSTASLTAAASSLGVATCSTLRASVSVSAPAVTADTQVQSPAMQTNTLTCSGAASLGQAGVAGALTAGQGTVTGAMTCQSTLAVAGNLDAASDLACAQSVRCSRIFADGFLDRWESLVGVLETTETTLAVESTARGMAFLADAARAEYLVTPAGDYYVVQGVAGNVATVALAGLFSRARSGPVCAPYTDTTFTLASRAVRHQAGRRLLAARAHDTSLALDGSSGVYATAAGDLALDGASQPCAAPFAYTGDILRTRVPASSGAVWESSAGARVMSLQASSGNLEVTGALSVASKAAVSGGVGVGASGAALYFTAGEAGDLAFDGTALPGYLDGSASTTAALRARAADNASFAWETPGGCHMQLNSTTGCLTVANQVVANGSVLTSDRRIKSDIEPVAPRDCTDAVAGLHVRQFRKQGHDGRVYGLVAQEVAEVPFMRPAVLVRPYGNIQDFNCLDYGQLVPVLVGCISDLAGRVAALEAAAFPPV